MEWRINNLNLELAKKVLSVFGGEYLNAFTDNLDSALPAAERMEAAHTTAQAAADASNAADVDAG